MTGPVFTDPEPGTAQMDKLLVAAASLDAHIERRARELATGLVEAVLRTANERERAVTEERDAARFEEQRQRDLAEELRRQLDVRLRRLASAEPALKAANGVLWAWEHLLPTEAARLRDEFPSMHEALRVATRLLPRLSYPADQEQQQ